MIFLIFKNIKFVYDPDVEYPYAVKTSVDIDTGESGQIKLENMINNRSESDRYNIWAIKRQDLTKIPWKDYEKLIHVPTAICGRS